MSKLRVAARQACVGRAANQGTPHVVRSLSIRCRGVVDAFERFLHVEAISGVALLVAAAAALIWANSPFGSTYHDVLHAPLTFAVGSWTVTESLHFWINEGLMTVFFLLVGLEIRRELLVGTLASLRLPLAAAVGGVAAIVVVAVFYSAELAPSGRPVYWSRSAAFCSYSRCSGSAFDPR